MEIGKYMKRHVVSIPETSTIREAAAMLVKHHIGLLPVVDNNKKLVFIPRSPRWLPLISIR